jgi:uncharacterized protein (TIGR02246 family)
MVLWKHRRRAFPVPILPPGSPYDRGDHNNTEVTMFIGRVSTLLSCVCLVLIGCTPTPPVDVRTEADAIRSIDAQWTAAFKARDIDKLVSLYASDAVAIAPDAKMQVGHQAIRESLQSWLADTVESETSSGTIDAVEVAASGDLAYARGSGRFRQNTPKGLVDCSEKWVTVYRKMDGSWKIIVDIITNDKPVKDG